ncbi:MAG: hypothetical protein CVV48_09515 [Spirochaetae bacterium HGW-Spirochaetae-4]|jgi:hypothetical protein|nr:MAG: hypothetical protein CVV52_17175 [Spirochaetae bacterium HGW-Spirochaetae-8]PKL21077.1 MAG: hypothetical protein CVV48_09515 [Spirochaetae bacterium HGW-Spirochaetae-4]
MASREIERRRRQESHNLKRKRARLSVSPTILIVCEGKNTEVSYFNKLKFRSATIVPVGEGFNTISLVERAELLASEKKYDEVWCVFDRDDFPAYNFNNAIWKARSKGFEVAYSNQAFEYWIILHFRDHQGGAMDRSQYGIQINRQLRSFLLHYDHDGSKDITDELFNLLFSIDPTYGNPRSQLAIERSRKIYNRFDHSSPATEESSTTMHLLFEHLMEFQRY